MLPVWVLPAVVGGVVSAAAGFFTRAVLKRTTHLEDEQKQMKSQIATLVDAPPVDDQRRM